MATTRREFLNLSLAAGAAAAMARVGRAAPAPRLFRPARSDAAPQKILILGGTAFLGPTCVEAALARGHKVTVFNRGRIETKRKEAGRPSVIPDGVEVLYGNRDPNKSADDDWKKPEERDPKSPKGLSQLDGRKWDAVIDTSGFFPRMVKASAELLAPSVRQYLFISTLSVYKSNDTSGKDESDELATLDDPNTEEFGDNYKNYGGGKAACEAAAEKAMRGRVANIRPGFIIGPRDMSGRFAYWPIRVEKGGEMAVPGGPTDPIQIIDVRDLAEWCIHLIETNSTGAFNATGPDKTLTMLEMLQGCKKGAKSDATYTFIDPKFCESQGLKPDDVFPLWISPEGENAGFHTRSVAKAVAAGLRFRPVDDTARATLEWFHSLPPDLQAKAVKLIEPEREAALLKAWKDRHG